jgi:hypothetical protein
MKTHLRYSDQTRTETDQSVIDNLVRKGWEIYTPDPEPVIPPTYTADQWLSKEGYGPTQLVTLLDLAAQLQAAGKVSEKLNAVKAWTNTILAEYVQSPEPKENWGVAPFSFNETVIEAYHELGQ